MPDITHVIILILSVFFTDAGLTRLRYSPDRLISLKGKVMFKKSYLLSAIAAIAFSINHCEASSDLEAESVDNKFKALSESLVVKDLDLSQSDKKFILEEMSGFEAGKQKCFNDALRKMLLSDDMRFKNYPEKVESALSMILSGRNINYAHYSLLVKPKEEELKLLYPHLVALEGWPLADGFVYKVSLEAVNKSIPLEQAIGEIIDHDMAFEGIYLCQNQKYNAQYRNKRFKEFFIQCLLKKKLTVAKALKATLKAEMESPQIDEYGQLLLFYVFIGKISMPDDNTAKLEDFGMLTSEMSEAGLDVEDVSQLIEVSNRVNQVIVDGGAVAIESMRSITHALIQIRLPQLDIGEALQLTHYAHKWAPLSMVNHITKAGKDQKGQTIFEMGTYLEELDECLPMFLRKYAIKRYNISPIATSELDHFTELVMEQKETLDAALVHVETSRFFKRIVTEDRLKGKNKKNKKKKKTKKNKP